MTKEEYVKKRKALETEMKKLDSKIVALERSFISDNAPYPIGTKVKVTETFARLGQEYYTSETECFVDGFEIVYDNVRPILRKIKGKGRLFYGYDVKIEPILK